MSQLLFKRDLIKSVLKYVFFKNEAAAAATEATVGSNSRVSQFVSNVNLSNIIQSNSFLRSDLSNFIEMPQNNPIMPNLAMSSSVTSVNVNNQHNNQEQHNTQSTVVDLASIIIFINS